MRPSAIVATEIHELDCFCRVGENFVPARSTLSSATERDVVNASLFLTMTQRIASPSRRGIRSTGDGRTHIQCAPASTNVQASTRFSGEYDSIRRIEVSN